MIPSDIIAYAGFALSVAVAWAITLVALRNWRGDKYLCDDCIFNNENDCQKPERPKVLRCTVYRNGSNHLDYEI